MLSCSICSKTFPESSAYYVCPDHPHVGNLDVIIPKPDNPICDRPGMFRYLPMMPLCIDAQIPEIPVGDTPLVNAPRIASQLGLKSLYIKDDGRNPTGSLKDRASAFVCSKAVSQGISTIAAASTGNAGAALAGIGASMGIKTIVFVPAAAPPAKLAQLVAFGSNVVTVDGTYDDAFRICDAACKEKKWYNRNTGYNPYTVEGKKTVSFEIAEQLGGGLGSGNFRAPDWVVVSVGDGNIITGVAKGFKDLFEFGLIDKLPKLLAVNAAGSPWVYECISTNSDAATMGPVVCNTRADSVSASLPADRFRAVRCVKETKGEVVLVPEADILSAIPELASKAGVFAEPAAALAYAGLKVGVSKGLIPGDAEVVVLSTGSGLKDVAAVQSVVTIPKPVPVDFSDFDSIV
ncbi:hypothetical protein RCL1_000278 [Eukaryota sp. TZLM3-RCL]